MKIRQGFVSNSSSSSFVCKVCGKVEAGYDMSLREAGMYECQKGHCFCESHIEDISSQDYIDAGVEGLNEDIKRVKKYISEYQEKVDNGLGEEISSSWDKKTNKGYVDYYKEHLQEYKNKLKEIKAIDINSEDFDKDDLVDFVEDDIYRGDFRCYLPTNLCPVCKKIAEENAQREENKSDSDWITYIELYNKFNGLKP